MADTKTPQHDYDAIALQAYEWLKKRRAKSEISTSEVVMKVMGLKWKDLDEFEKADEFLLKADDALLRLIERENEYVADFSAYEGMYIGLPYKISPLSSGRNTNLSLSTILAQSRIFFAA